MFMVIYIVGCMRNLAGIKYNIFNLSQFRKCLQFCTLFFQHCIFFCNLSTFFWFTISFITPHRILNLHIFLQTFRGENIIVKLLSTPLRLILTMFATFQKIVNSAKFINYQIFLCHLIILRYLLEVLL